MDVSNCVPIYSNVCVLKRNELIWALRTQAQSARPASVEKLEQAKARAEAAIARDAAIANEAIAQALKQRVMEAIKAIEQMEGD